MTTGVNITFKWHGIGYKIRRTRSSYGREEVYKLQEELFCLPSIFPRLVILGTNFCLPIAQP